MEQREEFAQLRTWAVIGASEDRTKFGNRIVRDLRAAGYQVYAVNPKAATVEGDRCYPDVQSLPHKPDVVDMVVPPTVAERVVDDCIQAGIARIWFQPGSESQAAIKKAQENGIQVVSQDCIMVHKKRFE